MKYDLFIRVALAEDLPARQLRRGDVATVVEQHTGLPGQEPGYTLEVFNALGETVDVVTIRESQIEELRSDELLAVRPLAPTAVAKAGETRAGQKLRTRLKTGEIISVVKEEVR